MAALWLYNVSLLVLLVTSFPGSQAIAAQHLCGAHLVDALYLVCGERGFIYQPRSDNSALRLLPPMAGRAVSVGGEKKLSEFAFQDQMEMMAKRTILDRCCHRPCSLFELEEFCHPPASSDTSA